MVNSYPASQGRNGMGRLRVWTDPATEAGIKWIRSYRRQSTSRLVGAAIALLWFALAEQSQGRKIVSLNSDGTVATDIM